MAELLWQSADGGDWSAPDLGTCPLTGTLDRMRWALVVCGATDPLRSDLRPVAVARAARRCAAALDRRRRGGSRSRRRRRLVHRGTRLAARLTPAAVVPAAAVNAALVLLADHELATSTMAVRVAASVRADLYDALAGRAGHAGRSAARGRQPAGLRAARGGRARRRARAPSTKSCASRAGCPDSATRCTRAATRACAALLALAEPLLHEDRRALVREVMALAAAHDVPLPNCDLALAALSWGTGMPPDTGRTHLRCGPGGGVVRPLPGGADRAPPALPGPGGLHRLRRGDDRDAPRPSAGTRSGRDPT